MKFDKIKTLKVLEFNILYCLMLMVLSKNLLHIDTPDCSMVRVEVEFLIILKIAVKDGSCPNSNFLVEM